MREIETPTHGPSWGGAFFVVPSDICLLFYVCANPPSGDLSGAALEVPSEALLHLVATFARCRTCAGYTLALSDTVVPSDAALCQ